MINRPTYRLVEGVHFTGRRVDREFLEARVVLAVVEARGVNLHVVGDGALDGIAHGDDQLYRSVHCVHSSRDMFADEIRLSQETKTFVPPLNDYFTSTKCSFHVHPWSRIRIVRIPKTNYSELMSRVSIFISTGVYSFGTMVYNYNIAYFKVTRRRC